MNDEEEMNIEFDYGEVQKPKLTSQLGIGNKLDDIWRNEEYVRKKEEEESVIKREQKIFAEIWKTPQHFRPM